MLEINSMATERKNAFQRLINRLNIAEERNSETEYISTEITQTETQREREKKRVNKTEQNTHELWDNIKQSVIHMTRIPEEKETNVQEFSKINERHQTTSKMLRKHEAV